jgi:membrane associated rhomboid family serine protease
MNLVTLVLRRLSTPHYVMLSIIAVSLAAFASERVKRALILNPSLVKRGEIYRLLTAGWIHGDAGHLVMNLFVMFIFSDAALKTFGPLWFMVFFATAVITAYVPTSIRFRNRPRYNSLGASGGVAAIMLSAIMVDPTLKLRVLFFPFPIPGVIFGVGYIAYSVWHSWGSKDGINHDAHFSGALYGALVTYLWAPQLVTRTLLVLRRTLGV